MKKYNSRIGPELLIPVLLSLGLVSFLFIVNNEPWGLFIVIGIIGYYIYLYRTTGYSINNKKLKITCGFLTNEEVDISSITAIKKVIDIKSVPAFSLRRLLIEAPEVDELAISPQNENQFIEEILAINPKIKVN